MKNSIYAGRNIFSTSKEYSQFKPLNKKDETRKKTIEADKYVIQGETW